MKTTNIDYRVEDTTCTGYLVEPQTQGYKVPGIVMYTNFWGVNEKQKRVAEKLATMGCCVLVADMYGNQQCGSTFDESAKLMSSVTQNFETYKKRILAPYELLKRNPIVKHNKMFSIGYCFGGASSLLLARMTSDLHGAISVHGLLNSQLRATPQQKIPKMLVLHGARDPMVSEEDIKNFHHEMKACQADYTFISFGLSTHAFTNTDAAGNETTAYNFLADMRSNYLIEQFIKEDFVNA